MPRPSVLPLLIVLCSLLGAIQAPSVLHIRVMLGHADQKVTPIARYTLLISDNPATAPPREVVTAADGTADVKLPPGNYTIESDAPFVFEGRAYTWTQTLDVPAGRDATLELTAANAEVAAIAAVPAAATPVGAPNTVGANILARWQDSVVELWTPTVHASGFVVSASGWVATNQRVVAGTTSVEVQLTPALKVAGTVVAAEPGRDVAIIRIESRRPCVGRVRRASLRIALTAEAGAAGLRNRRSAPPAEVGVGRDSGPRRSACARNRHRPRARERGRPGVHRRWHGARCHLCRRWERRAEARLSRGPRHRRVRRDRLRREAGEGRRATRCGAPAGRTHAAVPT